VATPQDESKYVLDISLQVVMYVCAFMFQVNLAAQTLSKIVADSLEFLRNKIKHPEFQNCEPTTRFLNIINNSFDLLNSRNPFGKGCHTPLRPNNENYWRPILLHSIAYLKGLRNKQSVPLYQTQYKTPIKGLIICQYRKYFFRISPDIQVFSGSLGVVFL
jgi:hypothetical protein